MEFLTMMILNKDTLDQLWLRHGRSSNFPVKSFSKAIEKIQLRGTLRRVWNGMIPLRVNPFLWFLLRGKLNIKDKLRDMKIISEEKVMQVLYRLSKEVLGIIQS